MCSDVHDKHARGVKDTLKRPDCQPMRWDDTKESLPDLLLIAISRTLSNASV